jgi:hypothetical protein
MHATAMHFVRIIPDWNSLESVRHAHSRLEATALVFFALLVVFDVLSHLSDDNKIRERIFEKIGLCFFAVAVLAEIAAYPYGQRNDTLSEQIIGSLDVKARDAADAASRANKVAGEAEGKAERANIKSDAAVKDSGEAQKQVAVVAQRAEQINQALGSAQYFLSSPELRDPEKLRKDLTSFKGKSALFTSYKNDGDGYFLCKALVSVAGSAGMIPIDQCGEQEARPMVFNGVPAFINSIAVSAPDDDTMLALGRIIGGAAFLGASSGGFGKVPHPPLIEFFVGRKPHVTVSTPAMSITRKSDSKTKRP